MDKHIIRNEIRALLNNISLEQYKARSFAIHKRLFNEPCIQDSKTIAVTISRYPEVDTTMIIEQLWKLGKIVVVPKCHPKTKEMSFYAIKHFSQLETVYMDLQEPIIEQTKLITKDQIETIIVPGIVFNNKGYRIGYGGGYYDRYLSNFEGTCIALAFDEQIINVVPVEAYDIPVHTIITDTKRILCTQNREES